MYTYPTHLYLSFVPFQMFWWFIRSFIETWSFKVSLNLVARVLYPVLMVMAGGGSLSSLETEHYPFLSNLLLGIQNSYLFGEVFWIHLQKWRTFLTISQPICACWGNSNLTGQEPKQNMIDNVTFPRIIYKAKQKRFKSYQCHIHWCG